jgi:hypothetical protein
MALRNFGYKSVTFSVTTTGLPVRLPTANLIERGAPGGIGPTVRPRALQHPFLLLHGHPQRRFPTDGFSHRGKGRRDGNLPEVRPQVPDGTPEGIRTPALVRERKGSFEPPSTPYIAGKCL